MDSQAAIGREQKARLLLCLGLNNSQRPALVARNLRTRSQSSNVNAVEKEENLLHVTDFVYVLHVHARFFRYM